MRITRLFLAALLALSGCGISGGVRVMEVDGKLITTVTFEMDDPKLVVERVVDSLTPEEEDGE